MKTKWNDGMIRRCLRTDQFDFVRASVLHHVLAVHKWGAHKNRWSVTHVPSGLAMTGGGVFNRKRDAKAYALKCFALLPQSEWAKAKPAIEPIRDAWRAIRQEFRV